MKNKLLSLSSILLVFLILLMSSCTADAQENKPAKNIIFLIGDGMGLQQMFAAYTVNGGDLCIDKATHVGLQKTQSADKYITDSAASGTAMACGKKTYNGAIGVDTLGNDLESILKVAEQYGKSTGLVSTSGITHATPASFIANEKSRNNYEEIAADFLKTDIDLFIGGGLEHFNNRKDGRDLTAELQNNGYAVAMDIDEVMAHASGKLAGFTATGHNPRTTDGRNDMLKLSTQKALELLNTNEKGFFIMIEGSQIDWGGHANNEEYVITETLDFFEAVEEAIRFAEEDGETLVVVTADHETGGMVVKDGDFEKKKVKTKFTSRGHTGIMIPVYALGPGAELFTGIYENTEFKNKFMAVWGIPAAE